ncbi:hypothetical protein ACYSNX_12970 [Myroides sp. LJL115]
MYSKKAEILPWFYVCLGFLVIILLYKSGFGQIDIHLKNLLNSSKIPKYDSSYQDINQESVLGNGNYLLTMQFSSDEPIKTWYNSKNELIVITEKIKGNSHSDIYEGSVYCAKLDLDGNLADRLSYVRNRKGGWDSDLFFVGYHINLGDLTYHTWALDGDTSKRNISVINENLQMTLEQQEKEYINIAKNYLFFTVYGTGRNKYSILVFIDHGQCKAFYFDFYPQDGWLQSRGNTNNNIFTTFSREKLQWVPIESPKVQYKYYYKVKRIGGTSNIGGNTRSTKWEYWDGILYTDLLVGRDTVKIKEKLWMNDDGFMDNVTIKGKTLGHVVFTPYILLQDPEVNYQLLNRGDIKIHVIQPKALKK